MLHWLCGYLPHAELQAANYVSPPGLGSAAGIKGALALAIDAAARRGGDQGGGDRGGAPVRLKAPC
jgi:hypothetical protein